MAMERIKRALELAREERARAARERGEPAVPLGTGLVTSGIDTSVRDGAEDTAGIEPPPAREPSKPLRSIEVNLESLREAHLLRPGMVGQAAHAFRLLRTQVVQRMRQRGWNALGVISPTPDDGKTFTAINLAIAIAADVDASALLVDLDLRAPRIHKRFGFKPEVGIDDCLRREASIADALVRVEGYSGLLLLPVRRPVEHSSELITSIYAQQLFEDLKKRYPDRTVVFDLPPVLATDDALAFLPQCDAALMVVGDGRTNREDLKRAMELLRETPVLGTVLNGSKSERSAEYAY